MSSQEKIYIVLTIAATLQAIGIWERVLVARKQYKLSKQQYELDLERFEYERSLNVKKD